MRAALQAAIAPHCGTFQNALEAAAVMRDVAAEVELAARDGLYKAMFAQAGSAWVPTCREDSRQRIHHRECHTVVLALRVTEDEGGPTALVTYVWEPEGNPDPMVSVNVYPGGNHDFPGAEELPLVEDDDDMGSNCRWQDDVGVLDALCAHGLWALAVDLATVVSSWAWLTARVPALAVLPPQWAAATHGAST
jgi:hypothetical protein